ncbi:MAG: hypothetical protein AAF745_02540 [Planctomycetota bacterium]
MKKLLVVLSPLVFAAVAGCNPAETAAPPDRGTGPGASLAAADRLDSGLATQSDSATVAKSKPLEIPEMPVGEAEDGGLSIAQVMQVAHETRFYRNLLKTPVNPEAVTFMQAIYADLPKRESPSGDQADWVERATKLVAAVDAFAAGDDNANSLYKRAVNCNSCHGRHRG